MDNFDPSKCPTGIKNEQEIIRIKDTFDMAIQRLEEKLDDVKDDINSLSEKTDKRFDTVDNKLDNIEEKFNKKINDLKEEIPITVDAELEKRKGSVSSGIIKWVFSGLFGGVLLSVAIAWVKVKLGL